MTSTETDVCSKHGEYTETYREISLAGEIRRLKRGCPVCEQERSEADAREREERCKAAYKETLTKAGVTKKFHEADFGNYEATTTAQKEVLRVCKEYADRVNEVCSRGENLLLLGSPGTGKNHLATAITKAFLAAGRDVRIVKVYKLLRQVKETYGRGAEERESDIIKRAVDLDLLIMDEWGFKATGTGELSETDKALIFEIVDDRYEAGKPTLIISNLNRKDLGAYIGNDRVLDRLMENHEELIFDWESYRGKK